MLNFISTSCLHHHMVKEKRLGKTGNAKMKLITHNMLTSNIIKSVTNGYPLKIVPKQVEVKTVDFNPEFITRMLPKIDWPALYQAAQSVGHGDGLPETLKENYEEDEALLQSVHHVLMQVEVIEGNLVCPESGREFPISSGIPNMLLNEDEV